MIYDKIVDLIEKGRIKTRSIEILNAEDGSFFLVDGKLGFKPSIDWLYQNVDDLDFMDENTIIFLEETHKCAVIGVYTRITILLGVNRDYIHNLKEEIIKPKETKSMLFL